VFLINGVLGLFRECVSFHLIDLFQLIISVNVTFWYVIEKFNYRLKLRVRRM
jgi:hypothetical protein